MSDTPRTDAMVTRQAEEVKALNERIPYRRDERHHEWANLLARHSEERCENSRQLERELRALAPIPPTQGDMLFGMRVVVSAAVPDNEVWINGNNGERLATIATAAPSPNAQSATPRTDAFKDETVHVDLDGRRWVSSARYDEMLASHDQLERAVRSKDEPA